MGGAVLVLNGPGRGERGSLLSLNVDKFCAEVRLASGRVLPAVEYEDVSKLHS